MTCIVGLVDKKTKEIILAADRGLFMDEEVMISDHPKVFYKEFNGGKLNMMFGVCGDASFCDEIEILDFNNLLIPPGYDKPVKVYMKEIFIPYLKASIHNLKKLIGESNFLVAIMGELFFIDSALAVNVLPESGYAVGSAASYARGALVALKDVDMSIEDKARIALEAAEQCSIYCRGPFDYITLSE